MNHGNGMRNAADLEEEIRQTRAELGRTVQQLAARVDVPARMRAQAAHANARVRRATHTPALWLVLAVLVFGVAGILLVLVIRGRRR